MDDEMINVAKKLVIKTITFLDQYKFTETIEERNRRLEIGMKFGKALAYSEIKKVKLKSPEGVRNKLDPAYLEEMDTVLDTLRELTITVEMILEASKPAKNTDLSPA